MQRYKGTSPLQYAPGCRVIRVHTPSNIVQDAALQGYNPPPICSRMHVTRIHPPPPICSRMQRYKGTHTPICSRMQRYKGTHTLQYAPRCSVIKVHIPSNMFQEAALQGYTHPPICNMLQDAAWHLVATFRSCPSPATRQIQIACTLHLYVCRRVVSPCPSLRPRVSPA